MPPSGTFPNLAHLDPVTRRRIDQAIDLAAYALEIDVGDQRRSTLRTLADEVARLVIIDPDEARYSARVAAERGERRTPVAAEDRTPVMRRRAPR